MTKDPNMKYKPPKYWVYDENNVLRAAQSTLKGAKHYMKPGRRILKNPIRK